MPHAMPSIFLGHGNPMNAISANIYTDAWRRIGAAMQRPIAILAISAHWYVPETALTISTAPRTIHDFGGFPRELYKVKYPAPGDPELASRVQKMLSPIPANLDHSWGLDHGTWSVLRHMYPDADIPVVQLSIDESRPPVHHYEIGRRLAPLRDDGILILGSGNLVHNLHAYAWGRHVPEPYDWAVRFEAEARQMISAGEVQGLIEYETLGRDAMLAIPTPDHFLPLLYILGTGNPSDPVSFPVEGVDGGSISMLALQLG